jgi:L-methionine (R)-S-oxide reductase
MSEINFFSFEGLTKEEKYKTILPVIFSLIEGESNKVANFSNIVSALKYTFDYYFWVGFYFLDTENRTELVIGPYQGKVPCTRLKLGKGVCSSAVESKKTILVNDVNEFPGHIACDSAAKSEIVVPIMKNDIVVAVLDVDSTEVGSFDDTDKKYLEELIGKISYIF